MQQLISSPPLSLHGINWQPLSAVQTMLAVSMRPGEEECIRLAAQEGFKYK